VRSRRCGSSPLLVRPLSQVICVWHPVGYPRRGDLAPGAGQPLHDRRLRHQERARDLAGRQAGHGPQRQGHLGLMGERGVAAGEYERQPVVLAASIGLRAW